MARYAVLVRALPYPEASRLVSPSVVQKGRDVGRMDEPTARLAEGGLPAFQSFALYNSAAATLLGGEYPERVSGARVSEAFFRTLAVTPALGRAFSGDELRTGAPQVIVLSDAVWTRRFGRRPTIVGERIVLDDGEYEVIGVMPWRITGRQIDGSFEGGARDSHGHRRRGRRAQPRNEAATAAVDASVRRRRVGPLRRRGTEGARRHAGADVGAGTSKRGARDRCLATGDPGENGRAGCPSGHLIAVVRCDGDRCAGRARARPGTGRMYAVTAYSVAQRTREIGVRMALGADRASVMRLVLRQGGILVGSGTVLGVFAAVPLVRFVSAMLFDVQPLDPAVFITVAALVTAVAMLAMFIPARRASRVDPMVALRSD